MMNRFQTLLVLLSISKVRPYIKAALPEKYHPRSIKVGWCSLTPGLHSSPRAWFQLLKLRCDELLTKFAFNWGGAD